MQQGIVNYNLSLIDDRVRSLQYPYIQCPIVYVHAELINMELVL